MERSAAVEVEDVLHVLVAVVEEHLDNIDTTDNNNNDKNKQHVLVAVVEEHLVLRRVALVTVSQGLPLTHTLGEATQARVWDLVEDQVKTDFKIWRMSSFNK